jgi:hypothetical protein
MGVRWGEFSCELIKLRSPDIILAADCFYDPADFENIVATICFFANRVPSNKFQVSIESDSDRVYGV